MVKTDMHITDVGMLFRSHIRGRVYCFEPELLAVLKQWIL
jgi:hypothetical protein